LTGDVGNQIDHVADFLRRLGQALNGTIGLFGLLNRPIGNGRGVGDLMGDPLQRPGHFLGSRGDSLDIGRGLFGRRRRGGSLPAGFLGNGRHALGRAVQFGGSRGDGTQNSGHRLVECTDQPLDRGRALLLRGAFGRLGCLQFDPGDGVILEDLYGLGHGADLVAPTTGGNVDGRIAFGQYFHGSGHGSNGPGNGAREAERTGRSDDQGHAERGPAQ
jgi:hypothetical protein